MGKFDTIASQMDQSARSRRDELAYLSDMIRELAVIADRLECATLTSLLDVARLEAEIQARPR